MPRIFILLTVALCLVASAACAEPAPGHEKGRTRLVAVTPAGPLAYAPYTAQGDTTVLDYVVYRWDRNGAYTEMPGS